MMKYEEQIRAYFDDPARQRELVEAVCRLVSIRSVKGEPQPGMPFGEGPARALEEALKLCGELGFATQNHDGYVGTAELNDKDTILHILAHMDVVARARAGTPTPTALWRRTACFMAAAWPTTRARPWRPSSP